MSINKHDDKYNEEKYKTMTRAMWRRLPIEPRASLRGREWTKLKAADAYLFEPKTCHIMTCQPFLVSYYVGISMYRRLRGRLSLGILELQRRLIP